MVAIQLKRSKKSGANICVCGGNDSWKMKLSHGEDAETRWHEMNKWDPLSANNIASVRFAPNYCFVYDTKRCASRMFDINNRPRRAYTNFSSSFFFVWKHFENVLNESDLWRYVLASRKNLSLKWNECELRIVCMRWQTIMGDGVYFYNFQ